MDLDHLLLMLSTLSSVLNLARLRGRAPGWSAVSALVLALGRRATQRGRAAQAAWLTSAAAALHPFDGVWAVATLARARAARDRGEGARAQRLFAAVAGRPGPLRASAALESLRAEGRWGAVRDWLEAHVSGAGLARDPALVAYLARALGEEGRLEGVLDLYARAAAAGLSVQARRRVRLMVLAFWGQGEGTEQTLAVLDEPAQARDFWRATALQAAGEGEAARALLTPHLDDRRASVREGCAARLAGPARVAEVEGLDPRRARALAVAAREARAEHLARVAAGPPRRAALTAVLIGANVVVFLLEIPGGTMDADNLVDMGALVLPAALADDTWMRVIAAGFLHFGALHLVLNAVGLWLLGSLIERAWGRAPLLICYFGALIGANALAIPLSGATRAAPTILVGASGAVMGTLGAAGAFVAFAFWRERSQTLRRQLVTIATIAGLQFVFDALTPQVSSTVHLLGLAIGALLGASLAWAGERRRAS